MFSNRGILLNNVYTVLQASEIIHKLYLKTKATHFQEQGQDREDLQIRGKQRFVSIDLFIFKVLVFLRETIIETFLCVKTAFNADCLCLLRAKRGS